MEVHLEEDEKANFIRAVGQALTASNSLEYSSSSSDANTYVGDCSGFGGSVIKGGSLGIQQPLVGTEVTYDISTNADWKSQVCKEFHVITEELLSASDEENIVGICDRCGVRVFIPRVPGAFSFEKAGVMIGRAMSLDADDEDEISTLVVEIEELQQAIDKDIRKYKRAMEVLQIARGMARKQLVKVAEPIE